MTIYRVEDLPARFANKIKIDGWGHWLWTGSTDVTGYGRATHQVAFDPRYRNGKVSGGRLGMSHRVVYELLVGPISKGLQIDHLCEFRSCCNPAHLEAVTRSVNMLRAFRGSGYIPAATGTQLSLDELLKQPQQIELL